jgi:hypothetical protein
MPLPRRAPDRISRHFNDCRIEMARYAVWSAARQSLKWRDRRSGARRGSGRGLTKSLVSACGGLGLRPASQCHFDAISGPEFQFEAHNLTLNQTSKFTVETVKLLSH